MGATGSLPQKEQCSSRPAIKLMMSFLSDSVSERTASPCFHLSISSPLFRDYHDDNDDDDLLIHRHRRGRLRQVGAHKSGQAERL